ncbi:MAG TPA: nucleoside triphosphate pyrophosphohydrolase [Dehalococcoidia bacterium]|nr:nucleoside triphosphate pyrophosphohydrolase [Dehalococcoidia bacterium]
MPENADEFRNLVDIVAKLRAPDGCPWDRKQTHQSLRATFLQECYEVLAALDSGDTTELCEELGDLMLHVVLQAQIAAEAGEFEIVDSLRSISEKIVSRHPHVFGSTEVKDAAEVSHNWAKLKQAEKGSDDSMLAGVPKEMPSLGYSQEIQNRVAQVGFDWEEDEGVIDKLAEEVDEFRRTESAERRAEEFGDLLFTLANIARRLEIDLESALREANQRFYRRFAHMEEICRQRGVNIGDLSFDEQNALWEEAKNLVEGK